MKKEYDAFTREAKELHNQMEEILAEEERDKIEEALNIFKIRRDEMTQKFKKLEETGAQAIERVKKTLKKWNSQEAT